MSTKTLLTVEDFAQRITADTEDYELVEGELVPLSSGTPRHAQIRYWIESLIRTYFARNPIGCAFSEIDSQLAGATVRRPGVSVFLYPRAKEIDLNKIPVPFAPDIAVEVLSPSGPAVDVHRKVLEYLAAGTQEVWLIDASNSEIFVHKSSGIRALNLQDSLETPLLPGFTTSVADLLA